MDLIWTISERYRTLFCILNDPAGMVWVGFGCLVHWIWLSLVHYPGLLWGLDDCTQVVSHVKWIQWVDMVLFFLLPFIF